MSDTDFNYGHNADDCIGMLVCPHCGKAVICNSIQTEDNMTIPRGNQQPQQRNNNRQRERNGLPYLSKREATTNPEPGMILETRVTNDPFKTGEQMVVLKIKYRNALWLFNLRPNSPILSSLVDAFGNDESTWHDRDVNIYNQEDDFDHRVWLVIEPADVPASNVPSKEPVKRSRVKS